MDTALRPSRLSRRRFMAAAAGAAAFSIVPRSVIGAGQIPPSGKINVAFVGVGSQGLRVMLSFLKHKDIQAVAVCDAVRQSDDFPQWGDNEFRNAVRELLGVNSGWEWLSPNRPIALTRTLTVGSGVAGYEPCRQIVDAYCAAQKQKDYKGCVSYLDYRELLEKRPDVDAVVVGTPDHLHAPISIAAMMKGKHVFCQKPMAHNVYEARLMAEVARKTGVATQVAVGVAASEDTRRLCEWISAGAIGPVRKVVNWSNRPVWPQGLERPKEAHPVPEGMDWNLWLGPAPERPFHPIYLPFVWRGWYDFGCGALGDMGCYSFDTIFRALKLRAPTHIEASTSERFDDSFPKATLVHYRFPARDDLPPVQLSWYDGGLKPVCPDDLDDARLLDQEGLMFIGNGGIILSDFTGGNPRLIPEAKMKAFQQPPRTLPRSIGHEREWIEACKGNKDVVPAANFEFSAMTTETLGLGNIAARTGQRLAWDSAAMKIPNSEAAQRWIRREYRQGWSL